jgi:hypothetical protein
VKLSVGALQLVWASSHLRSSLSYHSAALITKFAEMTFSPSPPFMIPNTELPHKRTHTHTNTHTQTQKDTHKRKNEAMSREHAIMYEISKGLFKRNNEVNMPLLEESRPQLSPAKKVPASMQPPSSDCQRKPKTPQHRAVQLSKRRQSGKRPVGDRADLVVVELPEPANHRVSKHSHSNRSPKITHTAQTPKPPSHIRPIYPLPIRLPLLFVAA